MVADGINTDAPASIIYLSVVSRDRIRIAFIIVSLNDLDICAFDIRNAYLNANCGEKIWMLAGK